MAYRRMLLSLAGFLAIVFFAADLSAQDERGKAAMKSPGGTITIDYGRPALKGRDMLSKLPVGGFWRLGKNEVTLISTPVDLTFGTKKLPKGSYSLWLKKAANDQYELFFNKQTTGHGMNHDAAIDVASVPMTRSGLQMPVETLTIQLPSSDKGGAIVIEWGTSRLTTTFKY